MADLTVMVVVMSAGSDVVPHCPTPRAGVVVTGALQVVRRWASNQGRGRVIVAYCRGWGCVTPPPRGVVAYCEGRERVMPPPRRWLTPTGGQPNAPIPICRVK